MASDVLDLPIPSDAAKIAQKGYRPGQFLGAKAAIPFASSAPCVTLHSTASGNSAKDHCMIAPLLGLSSRRSVRGIRCEIYLGAYYLTGVMEVSCRPPSHAAELNREGTRDSLVYTVVS